MVMEIVISLVLVFLGIAVLVLIHVCMVWRAFQRGSEEHSGSDGDGDGIVRKRMCREELNLPCFEYKEKEAKKGEGSHVVVDCAVCLESFKVGDLCRFLPNCRHSFHVPCIDSWILNTPICPICRTSLHSPITPTPTLLTHQLDVSDNIRIQVV